MKKAKLIIVVGAISLAVSGTANAFGNIYKSINYNYYTTVTNVTTTNIKVNVDSGQSEVVNQNTKGVAENKAWNDRQEGVIVQNRGRIDQVEKDTSKNTSGVKTNREAINTVDRNSKSRDKDLSDNIANVDSQSRDRDKALQVNVDQVDNSSKVRDQKINDKLQADMDWNIDQFNKQGQAINRAQAGVDSNRQAINGIREDVRNLESGIAGVASLNAVFDPNYDGLQSHVGTAAYGSGTAIGVSLGGRVSENNFIHAGASLPNRGSSVFQAGLTTRW